MRPINASELKKLHTLLSQCGLRDHKAELVREFTGGRTESSKQMTRKEAEGMIEHLESHISPQETVLSRDKMVRKLFYLAYEMGYDQPRSDIQHLMDRKEVVKQNLQGWLSGKHCKINRDLNQYSNDELRVVLSQFEAVHKSFMKAYKTAG
jgi:hypothetical protein